MLSAYHPVLQKAIRYLADTDFSKVDFGVYQIDDDFKVQVIDHTTKDHEVAKAEFHNLRLDIHFSITGEETVYYRNPSSDVVVAEDALAEKDVAFLESLDNEIAFPLDKGDYVIFFPQELHRPGCKRGENTKVKKIVVKIDMDKLN
jgi:YhcH/YjgK/YiaL family protein